jgi:hypothetical protein
VYFSTTAFCAVTSPPPIVGPRRFPKLIVTPAA